MTPEKARALRDEARGRVRLPLLDPHRGSGKHREIHFDPAHREQLEQARLMLAGLSGLNVEPGHTPCCLSVAYDIADYTLQGLETALIRQGFHLDNSLMHRLARAVLYFCEDTQLRNLRQPERLIKKSHEVYSKVWEHHPHGDHDDTPLDLREER